MSDLHVRQRLTDNFTMVSNDFARNPEVPMRATKLYLYLMSHAVGWKLSIKAAQNATGMGRGTVYAAINDLRKLGYMTRVDLKDENGYFSGTEYDVLAEPLPEHERDDVKETANSRVSKSSTRSEQQKQEETAAHNRFSKSGIPENSIPKSSTLKNNNLKKTNDQEKQDKNNMLISGEKSVSTPQHKESGKPEKQDSPSSQKYPQDFLDWYAIYPRKKAKGDALKAYKQVADEVEHDELMERTRKFARYVEQSETQRHFVPYPATWLRAAQWEDELESEMPQKRAETTRQAFQSTGARGKTAEALLMEQWAREDAQRNNQNYNQPQSAIFEWPQHETKEIEQ